ncbi:DUF202 domain-containing protein [Actinomadura logoneensis]|uniref:DUF202 domain-containing protein n=1 Tax=Actinomadura logoneensis TaxID=2293572 RepID=A0A372JK32_9ACTN|nr:DUF202 domain-containing protein [Actinomadura logoneensis]RFU40310.1 DUF202 domain-containing protein [Actinomadura logoneensis]
MSAPAGRRTPPGTRAPEPPRTLWDPGAQPERTSLAWTRTTVAFLGAGLLCVRLAPNDLGAALAAVAVSGLAALHVHRTRRKRRGRGHRLRAGRPVADPASVLLLTGVTVLLGIMGIVFALH